MPTWNNDEKKASPNVSPALQPQMDAEEKNLRGFTRLTSHPRVKAFVLSAEWTKSVTEDSSKRKKK